MAARIQPNEFRYDTLPEEHIRLVRLMPSMDSRLCCEMLSIVREQSPPFTALSYTWDDQARYRPLIVNGAQLNITPNVEAFLRQVHENSSLPVDSESASKTSWFWIDAICIDQSDAEERAQQVSKMKEIYEKATSVIIWLGDMKTNTALAFHCINENVKVNGRPESDQHESRLIAGEAESLSVNDHRVVDAFNELAARPYWRRAWIVQEVTTPKAPDAIVVWCGNQKTTFEKFRHSQSHFAQMTLKKQPESNFAFRESLHFLSYVYMKRREQGRSETLDLAAVLPYIRYLEATDPKDKLYAILLLTKERHVTELRPDYHLAAETLFTNLAIFFLERDRNLDLLGSAGPRRDLAVPSWVPDWTTCENVPKPFLRRRRQSDGRLGRLYSADAGVGNYHDIKSNSELSVRGWEISVIHEVLLPRHASHRVDFADLQAFISTGTPNAVDDVPSTIVTKPPSDHFPLEHGDISILGSHIVHDVARSRSFFHSSWQQPRDGGEEKTRPNMPARYRGPGITTSAVERDDQVCILKGSQFPMILRRQEDHWLVVGEAWIDGMMAGEAVLIYIMEAVFWAAHQKASLSEWILQKYPGQTIAADQDRIREKQSSVKYWVDVTRGAKELMAKVRETCVLALEDPKLRSKLRSAATEANVDESLCYEAFLAPFRWMYYGRSWVPPKIVALPAILKAVVIQEFVREMTEGTVYQMLEALDIKPDFYDQEFLLK